MTAAVYEKEDENFLTSTIDRMKNDLISNFKTMRLTVAVVYFKWG